MRYQLYIDSCFVCEFDIVEDDVIVSQINWSKACLLPGVDTGAKSICDFIADRIGNSSTRADILLWYGISTESIESFIRTTHLVSGFDKIHARAADEPEATRWWSKVAVGSSEINSKTGLF